MNASGLGNNSIQVYNEIANNLNQLPANELVSQGTILQQNLNGEIERRRTGLGSRPLRTRF